MATNNGSTLVVVAVIGLVGTLGAAAVANWDKLFGSRLPRDAVSTTTVPAPSPKAEGAAPPTPTSQAVCIPSLAVPADNAQLPQRRLDDKKVEANWAFGWRACPGATRYHLFVIGPSALNPIVDEDSITSATYQHRETHFGVTQREGWTWKVRAYVDGRWGDWSQERTFNIALPK